jgi:hypothetical protein
LLTLFSLLGGLPVSAAGRQGQVLRHQVARLEAAVPVLGEGFGAEVAISGDTVVVGAPYADDQGFDSGAAYIFQYDPVGQDWVQAARLTASDAGPSHQFGTDVAIQGDTVVVGAPISIPGGAVYVFYRDQGGPGAWGQVARVKGLDTSWNDYFGFSLGLDGDTLVVGAYAGGDYDGQAYIFYRNQGGPDAWGQVAKLVGSEVVPYDYFGSAVAVSGDTAVVGACGSGDNSTGAVYLFQRDQGGPDAWGESAKLALADGTPADWFGLPVAIHGDIAAVSASGRPPDGAVYLFYRDEGGLGNWGQMAAITATEPLTVTGFGASVSIVSDTLVVGAPARRPAGAAYLFARNQGGPEAWGRVARLTAGDAKPGAGLGSGVGLAGDLLAAGAPGDDPAGATCLFLLTGTPPGGVTITHTAVPVFEGQPMLLTGGFSDLDQGDTFSVTVEWGDGGRTLADVGGSAPEYSFTASYTYTEGPAVYPMTVTVVDGQGAGAWATSTITVNNVPPALPALPDREAAAGAPLTLTVAFADPGLLDGHTAVVWWTPTVSWTAVLSAGVNVLTTTYTYDHWGLYTVTVTVADGDGGEDEEAFGVSVYRTGYAIFLPLVVR